MKRVSVYDLLIAEYTYEECKKNEINLGLDLRGGMNVTLEVSVLDLIRNLSNNNPDPRFNAVLNDTQKNLGVSNNDDFITLFYKTFKARTDGIKTLLNTLYALKVKAPVGRAAYNNVIKDLATSAVKTEVYAGEEKLSTLFCNH